MDIIKNEILLCEAKWMELEEIMLNEISLTHTNAVYLSQMWERQRPQSDYGMFLKAGGCGRDRRRVH